MVHTNLKSSQIWHKNVFKFFKFWGTNLGWDLRGQALVQKWGQVSDGPGEVPPSGKNCQAPLGKKTKNKKKTLGQWQWLSMMLEKFSISDRHYSPSSEIHESLMTELSHELAKLSSLFSAFQKMFKITKLVSQCFTCGHMSQGGHLFHNRMKKDKNLFFDIFYVLITFNN